tara:strand:+ start:11542 stop:13026 length:1485 start_codon:yes stop_codon:yes gene_type:complete
MSQALAALSRNLIPLLVCITLAACNGSYTAFESDADFDTDQKTADIEQDNAELMTLAAYQSAFLGHYQSAAYFFLDASDLPLDAKDFPQNLSELPLVASNLPLDSDPTTIDKWRPCSIKGAALYTYTRNLGEAHKVGDRISVSYDNCIDGDAEYNGSMTATYAKIRGLNDRFVEFSTEQCLTKLQDKLNFNINNSFFDFFTFDLENDYFLNANNEIFYRGADLSFNGTRAISVPGDEIRFTRVENKLKVDILSLNSVDTDEGGVNVVASIDLSFYITKDQSVIFILRPKEPVDTMVTSIDGDQFYTVVALEGKKQNCQNFERTLNVNFNNFSTNKTDYLTTALNGNVTLLESQETANRVNQSFVDSNFTTTVIQGNTTEVYSMKDYSVEQAVNKSDDTYSYVFNGLVSNTNLLKGQVFLRSAVKLLGSFSSQYPKAGGFEMLGKGLERVYMIPDNLKIQLRVDYNGDSTGNGFGEFDVNINTTWPELFAREFKE